ncbi:MAG: Putative RNA polymerase sigma factor [uncultured Solirubrobacteraceae bacterium]|uniref:RNA polymerase sigma factor n=1 Tax=uncultured Solirubrobacteraceae bacterium TaxID=1162706 RepID=A0A6J4SX48_9ACTN|nr:MAG: Putative RNA polymerase sigma factor [uncultured Solirubrobacteraceae bacterium]
MPTIAKSRMRRGAGEVSGLVERAAARDDTAWQELVDEFGGLVWSITRSHRLADQDAADVSQTTWLRLVEHVERLQESHHVGAWLATTARRESLLTTRRSARLVPAGDDLPELADDAPAHDARLLEQERDDALWAAFDRLDERDRTLLRLVVTEPSPSYEKVGAALDMPVGSIGPTRGRALARLRDQIEDAELLQAV